VTVCFAFCCLQCRRITPPPHALTDPNHNPKTGCSKGGDQVDDTPYQSAPTEGCPKSRDSCPQPGEDPFWNFLDYTDDKCMKGFTAGQHKRMEAMWQLHREG